MRLQSFLPPSGSIAKVEVFPSNFGMERMREEERFGPVVFNRRGNDASAAAAAGDDNDDNDSSDDASAGDGGDDDDDEGKGASASDSEGGGSGGGRAAVATDGGEQGGGDSDDDSDVMDDEERLDNEKLRQYEADKLKYYVAVVTCDSVATASHLYAQCDGMEYEVSAATPSCRREDVTRTVASHVRLVHLGAVLCVCGAVVCQHAGPAVHPRRRQVHQPAAGERGPRP